MLTTSKPHGCWRRPAAATGLILFLVGCTPPGPKALLDGERLLKDARPAEAVRRLRTAVEFLPSHAQAWNHLGLAYHGARQPTEAAEAYQQAVRLDRNLAAAYFNAGCLYLESGEAVLASDSLWAYVGLQPRAVEGWVRLGQAQLRTRKWDQAERSFAEALRLQPGRVDALNGIGISYQQRRKVREAWQSFTNAVTRDPQFAPAWLNLGVIAHQNGAKGQAVQAYRQYAGLRPEAARQMDLAGVVRQLETPVGSSIQLPPAVQTNAAPATPAVSTNRAAVVLPPARTNAAPHVVAVPAPVGPTNPPVLARPPPAKVEVTPAAPKAEPFVAEKEPVVVARPAEPPPAAAKEGSDLAAEKKEAPAVEVASKLEEPIATPPVSAPTETNPPSSFVLPLPTAVSTASSSEPPKSNALVVASVPLDRVELPPRDPIAAGVRDDPVPAVSPPAAQPAASGTAPLVRPVSAQRTVAEGERAEKKGFWSRANPVGWFGSEEPKPEDTGKETAGGGWRWANPTTWFRGGSTETEGVKGAASKASDTPSSGPVATNALVVASIPDVALPPISATSAVRRVPSRPTRPLESEVADPVPPREIRRYAYLNPGLPEAGNRASARALLTEAMQEHRRERPGEAMRLYELALREDPSLLEAHQNLAVAALQAGDVPRALSAGETALALKPDAPAARLNFALALDRGGFPLDAAAEAEKVMAARPNDVSAHLLLGNLYAQKLGRPEQARSHYLRVIELDPENPQSVAIRRWLAGRK